MNEPQNTRGMKRTQSEQQKHSPKKSRKKTGSTKLLPRRIERLLKWKEKHNKLMKNNKRYVDENNDKYKQTVENILVKAGGGSSFEAQEKDYHSKVVALDCEMVGTGARGHINALARCSIVDYHGNVVFDKYVKPSSQVTDYRTKWSGIREEDLAHAPCFNQIQTEVQEILNGKIVVGHSLHHDFAVLKLDHPKHCQRDTAEYRLMKELTNIGRSSWTPSLRYLVKCLLGRDIQVGEHCSAADARAALDLYKVVENQWEEEIKNECSTVSYMDDEFWPSEIFI